MTDLTADIAWKKAHACNTNVTCVEVAHDHHSNVLIRDSKTGHTHTFTETEWRHFTDGIKNGDFDDEYL